MTFEVAPEVAQRLVIAQQIGGLSLSLRGLDENDVEKVAKVKFHDIVPKKAKPDVVVQEEKCFMNIRKGGELVKVPLEKC